MIEIGPNLLQVLTILIPTAGILIGLYILAKI
jgi:hypothetical protein